MEALKDISIIIISSKRKELLKACLESVLRTEYEGDFEVIVIDNGSHPACIEFLKSYCKDKPEVQYYAISEASKSIARNTALHYAQGKILYFLDDDVEVAEGNLQRLRDVFRRRPEVDIIGGPNVTPRESSFFQKCSGYVLSSFFGSAGMRFRYRQLRHEQEVDDCALILCNLAFRREVFDKENIRFEDMACNEENLMLYRLRKKGYAMLYSPELVVSHQRRRNLFLLMQQFFRYGRGRGQMTRIHPLSLPWFTILPSVFCVYLISLVLIHHFLYAIPLLSYVLLDLVFSVSLVVANREVNSLFLLPIIYPAAHVSYGLGFIAGLVK